MLSIGRERLRSLRVRVIVQSNVYPMFLFIISARALTAAGSSYRDRRLYIASTQPDCRTLTLCLLCHVEARGRNKQGKV